CRYSSKLKHLAPAALGPPLDLLPFGVSSAGLGREWNRLLVYAADVLNKGEKNGNSLEQDQGRRTDTDQVPTTMMTIPSSNPLLPFVCNAPWNRRDCHLRSTYNTDHHPSRWRGTEAEHGASASCSKSVPSKPSNSD
ncbi:hypothetical protein JMJ77_0008808, partial [Colletotrichum scovillei]